MRALVRVSGYLFRILSGPIPSRIPRTFACAKDAPLHSLIFNFFFINHFSLHTHTIVYSTCSAVWSALLPCWSSEGPAIQCWDRNLNEIRTAIMCKLTVFEPFEVIRGESASSEFSERRAPGVFAKWVVFSK